MLPIDHMTVYFSVPYENNPHIFEVTFVRISKYFGWHGKNFEGFTLADWITLDENNISDEVALESIDILADQAANSLGITTSTAFRKRVRETYDLQRKSKS